MLAILESGTNNSHHELIRTCLRLQVLSLKVVRRNCRRRGKPLDCLYVPQLVNRLLCRGGELADARFLAEFTPQSINARDI
jgi:hypothetical protein